MPRVALLWLANAAQESYESEEKTRRHDTCQRQEGNGKAADGQVRKNSGTESGYCANSRAAKYHHARNCRQNHPVSTSNPIQPEKAQINVDRTDHRHRNLRIENTLTDEHGNDVKPKKGAHVQVTVTAEPKT
jgi:hypothetical protein